MCSSHSLLRAPQRELAEEARDLAADLRPLSLLLQLGRTYQGASTVLVRAQDCRVQCLSGQRQQALRR